MATFKEMPQPRTFAPSKEDVLQNLQYFFGAPVSPEKLKVRPPSTRPCAHARQMLTHSLLVLRTTRSTTP